MKGNATTGSTVVADLRISGACCNLLLPNRRAILHQNSPSVKLRNTGGLAAGDVNKKEVCRKKIGNMRIRIHGEQAAESRNFAVNDDSIRSMSREEQTPSETPSSAVYRGQTLFTNAASSSQIVHRRSSYEEE
jgi:hypothetical protein